MKEEKVRSCPVFKTKEQEELFARCANETMFRYMNDEVLFENGKQKILKK